MYNEKNICVHCNQEFRRRPDLLMLKDTKVMYCSPHCSQRSRKRRYNDKAMEYDCRTCGSLVRGNVFTKTRKHCTDRCRQIFGNKQSTIKIKLEVEVIEPSEAMA